MMIATVRVDCVCWLESDRGECVPDIVFRKIRS